MLFCWQAKKDVLTNTRVVWLLLSDIGMSSWASSLWVLGLWWVSLSLPTPPIENLNLWINAMLYTFLVLHFLADAISWEFLASTNRESSIINTLFLVCEHPADSVPRKLWCCKSTALTSHQLSWALMSPSWVFVVFNSWSFKYEEEWYISISSLSLETNFYLIWRCSSWSILWPAVSPTHTHSSSLEEWVLGLPWNARPLKRLPI